MNQVLLRNVCEINPIFKNDFLSDQDSCSFIPMEFIDEVSGSITQTETRMVAEVKQGYTPFREGDVLFAKITPCMENGKCAVARGLQNGIGFGSTEFHVIRASNDVNPDWLYYFFRWKNTRDNAKSWMRGSAGQQRVPTDFLEELIIPLPPLPEQQRIAAILQKADRVRRLRRYVRSLSEGYLQSVFLEMFGDPNTNSKNCPTCPLRDLSEKFSDGPFGSDLKTEHYRSSGIRVIRLQNIGVGKFIDDDKAYISEDHFKSLSKHTCLPGDVIVGTLGDPNLRAFILPSSVPIALNKADCVQIRPNPKMAIAEYICWLLNMPQTLHLATGMIHGQTRERINMGRLAELQVPVPPLEEQKVFAKVANKYETVERRQIESFRQAEHLFQSLLARAFGGDL